MSEPSSRWIEDAFKKAGKDVLKASKDINHYLGAIDLIYTYACLDRDLRHRCTYAVMCNYVPFIRPVEILWDARVQALKKGYSLPALAKQFETMLKEASSQIKSTPETEKMDGLLSDHLDNDVFTTAMFNPLFVAMDPWTEKIIYRDFVHQFVWMITPDKERRCRYGRIEKHTYLDNPHEIGIVIYWHSDSSSETPNTENYRQSQYLDGTFHIENVLTEDGVYEGTVDDFGALIMDYGLFITTK